MIRLPFLCCDSLFPEGVDNNDVLDNMFYFYFERFFFGEIINVRFEILIFC